MRTYDIEAVAEAAYTSWSVVAAKDTPWSKLPSYCQSYWRGLVKHVVTSYEQHLAEQEAEAAKAAKKEAKREGTR